MRILYRLLHDEAHRRFPDEMFADLFTSRGRNRVPPRVVAVVMVLQRIEGLSDREAAERFELDAPSSSPKGLTAGRGRSIWSSRLVPVRARGVLRP